jgi:acyl carrier protein
MDEAIFEEVRALVADQLGVDKSTVTANASFEDDLRADSLTFQRKTQRRSRQSLT